MTDIRQWLESLKLEQYVDAFEENAIEWSTLQKLNHELLKEIGVRAVGHRVKMLEAIENLGPKTDAVMEPNAAVDDSHAGKEEAERRQLTVMFCDLVGSTELSRQLDPEELREINRSYQDIAKAAIERYEGYVARYMGDGVLAYFGYPRAHEDDVERSIRAGLELVDAISNLEGDITGGRTVELAVRVGIATGPVVVGDLVGEGASQENAVVGETPNLAARLQGIAVSNSVVVAAVTRDLASSRFEYEDLGDRDIKGIDEPVQAWRVIKPIAVEGRFEAVNRTGMTTLVGRDQEIALLLERWEAVKEGDGQLVLLSGEAGIGKSRIMQEFRERLEGEPHIRIRYQCSPYHTSTALYPVVQQLIFAAGLRDEDTAEERLDKVEHMLARAKQPNEESLALIAALLSIPTGDRCAELDLTPQERMDHTLRSLVDQLEQHSARQPVFVVFEDVQWIDPSTIELVELTINAIQGLRVLLMITFRPDYDCPWSRYSHATVLTLNRLTHSQTESVILHVADDIPLPDDVVDQIVAKTDGVPLFIEELTKNVLESGLLVRIDDRYELGGSLAPLTIPASLQDSLMARLDRMERVKEIAQIGATIGREFSYEVMKGVTGRRDDELSNALDQLAESELIFRRGTPPSATYTFKHALVQDAAYQSLLKSRRQQLHADIAEVITKQRVDVVQTQPELLAYHYTHAGLPQAAVEYRQAAAKRAIDRSAYIEAIEQLDQALEQTALLPPGESRDKLELELHVTKLGPLFPIKGYASPEAVEASARALELSRTVGDNKTLFPILYTRWAGLYISSSQDEMFDLSRELLDRANAADDDAGRVVGHRIHASTLLFRGEVEKSRYHAEQAMQIYRADEHVPLVGRFGQDLKTQAMVYAALSDAFLGNIDEALTIGAEAIAHVRNLNHVNSLVYALWHVGIWLQSIIRDTEAVHHYGAELLEVTRTHRLVFWEGMSSPHIAINPNGKTSAEAVTEAKRAIDNWRVKFGAKIFVPEIFCRIAEVHLDDENTSGAESVLSEAATLMDLNGELYWQPELYRLRGRRAEMVTPDKPQIPIAEYERAIEIAHKRKARLLELRAATALSRLLVDHSDCKRAKQTLQPVYERFTGGFDKPDLVEAEAALQMLD